MKAGQQESHCGTHVALHSKQEKNSSDWGNSCNKQQKLHGDKDIGALILQN